MYAQSPRAESGFALSTTLPGADALWSPAAAAAAPTSGRISKKAALPLDPTAEAAHLAREYTQSRLARLLAVRASSAAEAASKRAAFQAAQEAKARHAAHQKALQMAEQAQAEREAAAAQYTRAQQEFGQAQRASAELMARAQQDAVVQSEVRLAREVATGARFQKALTLVQRKNEATQEKRAHAAELKRQIKQQQADNRANLERQERAFVERTPAHMVEFIRAVPSPAPAAMAPMQTLHSSDRQYAMLRVQGTQGATPRTPATPHAVLDEDEDEGQGMRIAPTPHPHPSARKHSSAPHTPSPVAMTLNFASPFEPARVDSIMSPAALKQRSVAYRTHLQQQRAARSSSVPVPRPQQPKAFEIVLKHEGAIVRHSIDHAPALDAPTPKSRAKTVRSAPRRRTNFRATAVSTIPVLVPNFAFFEHSPRRIAVSTSNFFRPEISTANHGVSWVIPNEANDQMTSIVEEKTNEVAQQPSQEQQPLAEGQDEIASTPEMLITVTQPEPPKSAPLDQTPATPALTASAASTPFAFPLLPLASAAAARNASDQAFLSAASMASASLSAASSVAATPVAALRSNKKPLADVTLDQQLSHILQRHLQSEEHLASPIAPQQLMVSPHVRAPVNNDDDSSEDENEHSGMWSPVPSHRALASFTTPSVDAASSASSPSFISPQSALTPAQALLARPTAATDLFIESINYFIEMERAAAVQLDQDVVETVAASTPLMQRRTQKQIVTPTAVTSHAHHSDLQHVLQQIDEEVVTEERAVAMPMPRESAFSSPTQHVAAVPYSPLVGEHLVHTPAPSHHLYVMASPSMMPPSTDRKALFKAFANLSDAEFAQAAPVQTPIHSAAPTPARTPVAKYAMVTPQRPNARAMQQRFEQRMDL